MASCSEHRVVAQTFGAGETTVNRYLHRFCEVMARKKHTFIQWYENEEAAEMADYNRGRYMYLQAIDAIDGTHIAITLPADGMADYTCRKQYPSIVLQAVADSCYMFRDIYCNTPGSAHDAAVCARSPLSTLIEQRMPQRDIVMDGTSIPRHILGDPAYRLTSRIMKGYTGRHLTPVQESLNVYLSSTRLCVEVTFGRLKSRWRILKKKMDCNNVAAPNIITTACILHNICEKHNMPLAPALGARLPGEPLDYAQPPPQHHNGLEHGAGALRDTLAAYLANTQPLRRQFHN